ncbi:hypothetical protein AVEN_134995-1, partial [Araneus ventricosus]
NKLDRQADSGRYESSSTNAGVLVANHLATARPLQKEINDQTGSVICAISIEAVTKSLKAKLIQANTVFRAEILALKAVIEWVDTANEEANIWRGSESNLRDLKSPHVKRKINLEAQMALPGNAMIRLGWVKAHIVIKGNEKADILAKDATRDGTSADHPFPKSYLKKQQSSISKLSRIMVRLADQFTTLY